MRCDICQSETPPHYRQSLAAWICHTCKALGKILKYEETPVPPQDAETHDAVASAQEVPSTEEQEPVINESTVSLVPPTDAKKKTGKL